MWKNEEQCGKMRKNEEKMRKNVEKWGKMRKNEEKWGKMRKNEEKWWKMPGSLVRLGVNFFFFSKSSLKLCGFDQVSEMPKWKKWPFFGAAPPLKYCVLSRGRPEGGRGKWKLRVWKLRPDCLKTGPFLLSLTKRERLEFWRFWEIGLFH